MNSPYWMYRLVTLLTLNVERRKEKGEESNSGRPAKDTIAVLDELIETLDQQKIKRLQRNEMTTALNARWAA